MCPNAIGHHTHRFVGGKRAHRVFEGEGVDENLILGNFIAIVRFERFDQLLLHRDALREGTLFEVCRRSHALTVEGNVDLFDVAVELILHALTNVLEALRHFVDVVHAAFANEVCRRDGHIREHIDSSFAVYASDHAGDFGRADGNGRIKGTVGVCEHIREDL